MAKNYYLLNRDKRVEQIRERRVKIASWARTLKGYPCTDCGGEFHFAAMHWDHIGTDKESEVAKMVRNGCSKTRILAEISKCELVCSNCHAVRTYERGMNYRSRRGSTPRTRTGDVA